MKPNINSSAGTKADSTTKAEDTIAKTNVVRSLQSKYSVEFERDFNWYLSMRHNFNFDGALDYFKRTVQIYKRKVGEEEYQLQNEMPFATFKETYPNLVSGNSVKSFSDGMFFEYAFTPAAYQIVLFDKNGVSGKEAFYQWDSNGKILPTKHANLFSLLKTKGSANLHIKMYAEDRAKGLLPLIEFSVKQAIKIYGKFSVLRIWIKTEGKELTRKMISNDFEHQFNLPQWFIDAVENQKFKHYEASKQ